MPDDPISQSSGASPGPEDKLRKLFDDIERDEAKNPFPRHEIPADESQDNAAEHRDFSPPDDPASHSSFHNGPDEMSEHEEELNEEERKLKEIDERLSSLRGRLPDPPEWDYKRPKTSKSNKVEENNYLGMGIGISIAYTMVGCTLAGWGIGKLIDLRGNGFIGQAIGTLVGAVIGLVAAIFTIIRAQNKPGQ